MLADLLLDPPNVSACATAIQWTTLVTKTTVVIPIYNSSKQYPKGSYVTFDNQVFMSIRPANTNQSPYTHNNKWILVIPANTYPTWNSQWNGIDGYEPEGTVSYFGYL